MGGLAVWTKALWMWLQRGRSAPYNWRPGRDSRGGLLGPGLSGSCLMFSCVWCMLTPGPLDFSSSIKRPLCGWLSSSPNSPQWVSWLDWIQQGGLRRTLSPKTRRKSACYQCTLQRVAHLHSRLRLSSVPRLNTSGMFTWHKSLPQSNCNWSEVHVNTLGQLISARSVADKNTQIMRGLLFVCSGVYMP